MFRGSVLNSYQMIPHSDDSTYGLKLHSTISFKELVGDWEIDLDDGRRIGVVETDLLARVRILQIAIGWYSISLINGWFVDSTIHSLELW